jgi:hypothetical protein
MGTISQTLDARTDVGQPLSCQQTQSDALEIQVSPHGSPIGWLDIRLAQIVVMIPESISLSLDLIPSPSCSVRERYCAETRHSPMFVKSEHQAWAEATASAQGRRQ